MTKTFGIDISKWNKGLNIAKAKAEGVTFAVLRAGYHTTKDGEFDNFYNECKKNGLNVGCYLYSTATTPAEAKAEADALINIIRGKQFEFPVYIDVEDKRQANLPKTTIDAIITMFCETMENAGYFAGFYCNTSWFNNRMNGDALAKKYTHWRASWTKAEITNVDLWQFGGETNEQRSNMVAGMIIDQNYCYRDFPTIIKTAKLNGFGGSATAKPTATVKPTTAKPTTAKPTTAKPTTAKPTPTAKPTNEIKTGAQITLKNTPLYVSSSAPVKSSLKTGTYYIWHDEIINNRVRVTNSASNVGKRGQITGWVNVFDIGSATKPTKPTAPKITEMAHAQSRVNGYSNGKRFVLKTTAPLLYGPNANKYGAVVNLNKNTRVVWFGYYTGNYYYVSAGGKFGYIEKSKLG